MLARQTSLRSGTSPIRLACLCAQWVSGLSKRRSGEFDQARVSQTRKEGGEVLTFLPGKGKDENTSPHRSPRKINGENRCCVRANFLEKKQQPRKKRDFKHRSSRPNLCALLSPLGKYTPPLSPLKPRCKCVSHPTGVFAIETTSGAEKKSFDFGQSRFLIRQSSLKLRGGEHLS